MGNHGSHVNSRVRAGFVAGYRVRCRVMAG